jgi:hypothetical protein
MRRSIHQLTDNGIDLFIVGEDPVGVWQCVFEIMEMKQRMSRHLGFLPVSSPDILFQAIQAVFDRSDAG